MLLQFAPLSAGHKDGHRPTFGPKIPLEEQELYDFVDPHSYPAVLVLHIVKVHGNFYRKITFTFGL